MYYTQLSKTTLPELVSLHEAKVVFSLFYANDGIWVDVPPRLLINFIIKKEIKKKGYTRQKVCQATVNYRIPPGEPRSTGRQSLRMLCLMYRSLQGS